MNSSPGSSGSSSRSFGRTVVAGLILLVAAYVLFGLIIHIVSFLLSAIVFVVAIVALVWALRVLL